MSTTTGTTASGDVVTQRLRQPTLPRAYPAVVTLIAGCSAALVCLLTGGHVLGGVVLAVAVYVVVTFAWSLALEKRRRAVDRLVTMLVWASAATALVPLVWLLATVAHRGGSQVSWHFLSTDMFNLLPTEKGGISHALVGTLVITAVAALISVPIGLLTAIYLVEYGSGNRVARTITFLVDVMTGIPSIVAGLFALALFVLIFGPDIQFGLGGSVAISLLMIPIVVRSSEEMLRLVPMDLREASYALGVPKWRTIVKVVVPTALSGIITGVTLAISRVIGETAPLLVVAGFTAGTNANPFSGPMTTLSVYSYHYYQNPGSLPPGSPAGTELPWREQAFGAVLVLIVIVLALNIAARVVGRVFAPKTSA